MAAGLLILGVMAIAAYLWLAQAVGKRAEAKGRSFQAWQVIALVFGIILPALIVACMREEPAPSTTTPQPRPSKTSKVVNQLEVLKAAHEHGFVSAEEYEARKRRLLDSI